MAPICTYLGFAVLCSHLHLKLIHTMLMRVSEKIVYQLWKLLSILTRTISHYKTILIDSNDIFNFCKWFKESKEQGFSFKIIFNKLKIIVNLYRHFLTLKSILMHSMSNQYNKRTMKGHFQAIKIILMCTDIIFKYYKCSFESTFQKVETRISTKSEKYLPGVEVELKSWVIGCI